jgi:hypothetical protein
MEVNNNGDCGPDSSGWGSERRAVLSIYTTEKAKSVLCNKMAVSVFSSSITIVEGNFGILKRPSGTCIFLSQSLNVAAAVTNYKLENS